MLFIAGKTTRYMPYQTIETPSNFRSLNSVRRYINKNSDIFGRMYDIKIYQSDRPLTPVNRSLFLYDDEVLGERLEPFNVAADLLLTLSNNIFRVYTKEVGEYLEVYVYIKNKSSLSIIMGVQEWDTFVWCHRRGFSEEFLIESSLVSIPNCPKLEFVHFSEACLNASIYFSRVMEEREAEYDEFGSTIPDDDQ